MLEFTLALNVFYPPNEEDYDFKTEPCHNKNIFFVKRINRKKDNQSFFSVPENDLFIEINF